MPTNVAPSPTLPKAEYERLAEFRYRLRRFLRFSEEISRVHGVTALQYQLLLQLRGFPGREWASVGELAERLQAHHHGVVALISRCEAMGLVQRVASDADRRQVEVHLTARGVERVATLAALHRVELGSLGADFARTAVSRKALQDTRSRRRGRRED